MLEDNYDAATFRKRFGPWALVAGASDGIGECFARDLAERGLNVVLLARREALLEELAQDIRSTHGVETRVLVADLTGDGLVNFFDVAEFLSAFAAMEPAADFTGDGLYNFFDVADFLSAFAEGCP